MKKRSLLMAGMLLASTMFAFTGCGSSDAGSADESGAASANASAMSSLDALKEKGTLTVGMMAATPPYEFHKLVDGEDEIIGCDIRLLDEVCADLGVDYELKDMDFEGLLMAMQAGKIDMIISAMSPTEERSKNADFSDVYYKDRHQIIVHKDDAENIKTAEDLSGKTIGCVKSSVQEQIVLNQIDGASAKSLGKSVDLGLDLASKKIDAVLVDIPTAKLLTDSNDKLVLADIFYDDDTLGAAIAMPKGTGADIMESVNGTIARVKDDFGNWVAEYMEQVDTAQ